MQRSEPNGFEGEDAAAIAAQNSPDGLVVIDGEGRIRWSSDASQRLMGFTADELVGRHLLEFVHPDELTKAVGAFVEASRRTGFHLPVHFRVVNREGAFVDCDVNGRTFERDGATWMVVSVRALAEQNVVDARRGTLERLLQRASVDCSKARWFEEDDLIHRYLGAIADVVGAVQVELAWGAEGSHPVIEASWPLPVASGQEFVSLWDDDDPDGYGIRFSSDLEQLPPSAQRDLFIDSGASAAVEMALSTGGTAVVRFVLGENWLWWDDPNAEVVALLASTLMSTSRRCRAEEQLHERARRDPMTGLFNREELYRALGELLARPGRAGRLGVLYGDLDHFKDVNDRFGHAEGDRLLVGVAAALVANVRDGDLVSRFGGDEFVVVCPELDSTDQLESIAERVASAVCRLSPPGLMVRISFGSAMARIGVDADELVHLADESMYSHKRARDHTGAS